MKFTMKTFVIFAFGALVAGSAFAQGNNLYAPTTHRNTLPPANIPSQTEGSLQRGVRVGNPVQMFSPFAPAQYGDGHEFVTPRDQDQGLRPRDNSRNFPIGLRLFSISF